MSALNDMRHGLEHAWVSLAQGWKHLSSKAEQALTRFNPSKNMEEKGETLPVEAPGWGLLAGEVFEDDHKIVVRIEAPGLDRDDFDLEMRDDLLIVRGEKRFQRESREGGYRLMECAYGSFHRAVPLPAPVQPDQAKARYCNGVLRIELPKAEGAVIRRIDIEVR